MKTGPNIFLLARKDCPLSKAVSVSIGLNGVMMLSCRLAVPTTKGELRGVGQFITGRLAPKSLHLAQFPEYVEGLAEGF